MKTYSPAFSAFAGQPVYVDESKMVRSVSITFQPQPWHQRQVRECGDESHEHFADGDYTVCADCGCMWKYR